MPAAPHGDDALVRLSALLDASSDWIWQVDADGRITASSPGAAAVLGVAPASLVGRAFLAVVDAGSRPAARRAFGPGAPPKPIRGLCLSLRGGDDRPVAVRIDAGPLPGADGAACGWIGLARRIDDAERVRRRRRFEALGTLTAGIAHEFNNILTTVIGYAELLQGELPAGSLDRDAVDEILVAGGRARDLVSQLLVFARNDEHGARSVAVTPLAKEVLRFVRTILPSMVEVLPRLDERAGHVVADPVQVHELLVGLCAGLGERAANTEGGRLELRVASQDVAAAEEAPSSAPAPGAYTVIEARATGSGPAAPLDTARAVVADLGGAMTVTGAAADETTVCILLPRAAGGGRPSADPTPPTSPPGARERILVVDDEPSLVRMLVRMLGSLGYEVRGETSGRTALALLRESPADFDLVVADQSMPGVTGVELLEAVSDLRPGLPVVLCTGHSERVDRERAEAAGVAGLLEKPFRRDELGAAVRAAFDRAH